MSVIETYRTVKGGVGLSWLKEELLSQGCEILGVEPNVPVPFCEGCTVLGDRITVRRFSKDERNRIERKKL